MNHNRNIAAFFLLIEAVTIILLLLPFFQHNNLYSGDMPGHYMASWYIKDFLFPRAFGWNPFVFAGYPQGQLYPFLFHYLSAILGIFTGLETGFKLMVCASILAAPISFYYFSRKFQLNSFDSGVCMMLMWFIMFVPDRFIGGNYVSTLSTGMVSNMLAIPMLFLYYGKLAGSLKNGKYIIPSIILALIVLTHIFTALTALVFLASFYLKKPKKEEISFLIKHGSLSFLLTAFWAVPFLDKLGYSSLTSMPTNSVTAFTAITFIFFAVIFFAIAKSRNEFRPVVNALGLLALLIILGSSLQINLHYYRFFMPILLLMPLCLIQLVRARMNALNTILASSVILPILIILGLSLLSFVSYLSPYKDSNIYSFDPGGPKDINMGFEKVAGRVMPVALKDTTPAPYSLDTKIPMETGNWVLWGLFIDSSSQKCIINHLILQFNPYFFRSCGIKKTGYDYESELLSEQLRIYGVNYVFLSAESNLSDKIVCGNLTFKEFDYGLMEKEALSNMMVPNNDYEEKNILSALGVKKVSSIAVLYENKLSEEIQIQKKQCESGYVTFTITPDQNARIFLTPDFRYWRAYVDGREVEIYDGGLLSFQGNGTIELKYKENPLTNMIEGSYLKVPVGYKNQTFGLYKIGNSSIAEILNYSPETISDDWDDAVWKWFTSKNISQVLVYTREDLSENRGESGQKVEVLNISHTGEYMKFFVPAEKPVPVYIKVTYFPNWKAYVNGKETRVYMASPYMMLVYGSGIVELKYESLESDYLGGILSIAGIIWLAYASISKKRK
jgi:hypothetical protein